ncbi:MAG: methyltransferase domain-containing protein [Bryobacteraceae bacterium]
MNTYDALAEDYHLIFEDWHASMTRQAAAIAGLLGGDPAQRVLDCACGIGTQSLGLSRLGFDVLGTDVSAGAVTRAAREAEALGVPARFRVADMRRLDAIPESGFDAVIAMDNSLPHLETSDDLRTAAAQMRGKLRDGGRLLVSTRDYDEMVRTRPAVLGPAFYRDGDLRRIVHFVLDWEDERQYRFHIHLARETGQGWEARHYAGSYRAILREELACVFGSSGFSDLRWMMPGASGYYQPVLTGVAARL